MKLKRLKIVVFILVSILFSMTAWGAANVIVVSKDYGDFSNPVDAIESITEVAPEICTSR